MTDSGEKKYFDKAKQEKAIDWLNQKWPKENRRCDICHHISWTIGGDLVMPIRFTGNILSLDGPTYPQIMIICSNCGNTKYINAVIAQVEASSDKIEAKDEK